MNLNLVIDTSQFKPFDYNIALNAIKEYNQGYERQLAVYDKIALTLGDLASAVEGSTKAKEIYDNYKDLFDIAASDFARGMNFKNARLLGELRKLYGTQIRQLEKANEARVKEAERRRAVGPEKNMLWQDMGNLDAWMQNPDRVLGSYSGTQLTSEVSTLMKAAGESMIRLDAAGRLDPYHKTWLKTKGFSADNVNKAVAEVQLGGIDNVSDPIMRQILQSAMNSSGIYNWADDNTKRTAEIIASRGLYGGIGQSDMGSYEDKAAAKALDYNYAIRLALKQADIEMAKAAAIEAIKNGNTGDYAGESVPINFSDSKVAGQSMKRLLAEATYKVIEQAAKHGNKVGNKVVDNYYALKIIKDWEKKVGPEKAKEAMIEHWIQNGFDGSPEVTGLGSANRDGFYWLLRDYLRKNVTKNENLINIWTSPYETAINFNPTNTTTALAMLPIKLDEGNSRLRNNAKSILDSGQRYYKSWKNFNEEAAKGFTINGIHTADDEEVLAAYLNRALARTNVNGQVNLYDLQEISPDGTFKYGTVKTKIDELPTKTVNGSKVIDTDLIAKLGKIQLNDDSWILMWPDKDGNIVRKVLPLADRGLEEQKFYNALMKGLAEKRVQHGENSKEYIEAQRLAINAILGWSFDAQRLTDVKPIQR